MELDSLLPEDHYQHQYGGSKHTAHPLDDIFGLASHNQPDNVVFVYVGPGRGRYEESTRGNYHYVGPGKGHYEKECQPPDHTARYCFMCCCCTSFVIILLLCMRTVSEEPPFDCVADIENWQTGWSIMKKEYCCSNEDVGCPGDPAIIDPPAFGGGSEPLWLMEWLPDLGIGAKFILTMILALMFGCCIGVSMLYIWVRYFHRPKPSKTELELVSEIKNMLDKAQSPTKGNEIQITMMWDTNDDLDLHLALPGSNGEVSVWNKEHCGFVLDVDANTCYLEPKKKITPKPIESISFALDPENPGQTPPPGDYFVWCKVYAKHDCHKTANVTVSLTISGKREVFHVRILPGMEVIKVCGFHYAGPQKPGNHGPSSPSNHTYH